MARDFPRTAGQSAAMSIRQQIMSGALAPGATLNQNELATAMGMSRIPIRDALRALAAEGLVQMRAHATASVSPLSLEELTEVYEIRLALEPELCAIALPTLSAADLEELKDALDALEQANDPDRWLILNDEFHKILYRRAPRPLTIEIIQRTRQATARYTRVHHQFEQETVAVEHRLIYEAANAGHGRRLASLIAAHLADGYETMLRHVAQHQDFPSGDDNGAGSKDAAPTNGNGGGMGI